MSVTTFKLQHLEQLRHLGWSDGEVEFACIPIRHCPWCGDELKAVDA